MTAAGTAVVALTGLSVAALLPALWVLAVLTYDEVMEILPASTVTRLHHAVTALTMGHVNHRQRPPGAATATA